MEKKHNELEERIRESKECIEKIDLNEGNKIYLRASNRESNAEKGKVVNENKTFFSKKLIIRYACVLFIVALAFGLGLIISPSKKIPENNHVIQNDLSVNYSQKIQNITPAKFSKFEGKEELIDYLFNNKDNVSTTVNSGTRLEDLYLEAYSKEETYFTPGEVLLDVNDKVVSGSSSYSTNVQVENVDEADIVKVKGNHIFYLTNKMNKLYMFTEENGKLEKSKEIGYESIEEVIKQVNGYELVKTIRFTPKDLYVTEKYLIVRVNKVEWKSTKKNNNVSYNTYDYSNICLFEIYDINSLNLVSTIETAGSNVSTRLIDDCLYVVNNYNDYKNNSNNRFYYYPYFYIGFDIYYPIIGRIYYCEDSGAKTYVSIYKIKLEDEINVEDLHILTPNVNNIYSTDKNIYLIRSYGSKDIEEEDYKLTYSNTRVTVVNIEDGLELSGAFDVKGSINDKYCIDEKDEYIRVVTTGSEYKSYYFDKKYVYRSETNVFNYLTIFKKEDNDFVETGAITEGLGKPGETVRSARFNGDIVTIVTFKNTEPLYYVDISDPNNPVITSALEITGYSIYQHPYKDNYVIGFGYNGNNIRSGIKITLFDVSDKNNIKAVGNSYIIETRVKENIDVDYNYREINTPKFFNEPKALFVNNELGIFGFRLTGYNYYHEYNGRSYGINYDKTLCFSQYLTITIDEDSDDPIEVCEIAKTEEKYRELIDGNYVYYNNIDEFYQRLVFIGDNYYLLSDNKVDCFKIDGKEFKLMKVLNLD